MAHQSDRGITVHKWKDKRYDLMLSTKQSDSMIEISNKFGLTVWKPEIVIDYNKGKSLVDLCDQRFLYHSPLRKSLKWYKKVAIEILLNTSVLNAMSLYNKINKNNIGITEFKEILVQEICDKYDKINKDIAEGEHKLTKSGKISRCKKCYDGMTEQRRIYILRESRSNQTTNFFSYFPTQTMF